VGWSVKAGPFELDSFGVYNLEKWNGKHTSGGM
jgi:hypothetical protein